MQNCQKFPKLGYVSLVDLLLYQCISPDAPARTVGWRDPGFIHTSFLKELWPNAVYVVFLSLHMIFFFWMFHLLKDWGFQAMFYAERIIFDVGF